jgi:hypothetical protein
MSLTSDLTQYLVIGSVILLLMIILGFLNFYISIPKKLRAFLNFSIIIATAAWLLKDLGMLDSVLKSISDWIKSL